MADSAKLEWVKGSASARHLVSAEAIDIILVVQKRGLPSINHTTKYRIFSCGPPDNIVYYGFVAHNKNNKKCLHKRLISFCLNDVQSESYAKKMCAAACNKYRINFEKELKQK